MQITVDQLQVNYELLGTGNLLVLLHGWGDSTKGLTELQTELAKSYQVLAIDLPGFGATPAPPKAWGLTEYADLIGAVISSLKLTPYAFIGHSFGGAIGVRGLGTGSLQAHKLVLLASTGIRDEYYGGSHALRLVAKTGKALAKPLPGRLQRRLRSKAYATIGSDKLVAEKLQPSFERVVTDDVRADAERINIPCLLIYGYDDTATPIAQADLLQASLGHSELHVVPEAGHFVHIDKPAVVYRLVKDFLR